MKPLELGIIIVAILVILLSGYKIYESKKATPAPKAAHAADNSQSDISLTANWLETTSRGGNFSMKIPDGWSVQNYASGKEVTDQITGTSLAYTSGTKATSTDQGTTLQSPARQYGIGTQFNVFILNKKYQYSVKADDAVKSSSKAVTRGGLSGTLTTTQYGTATLPNAPHDQTEYVYTFPLPSEKTLVASYVQQNGQPDQTQYFEQAIRTIQIIK